MQNHHERVEQLRSRTVASKHNEELLRQLIGEHGRVVRACVARFEFDHAEAEEIAGDVFMLAFDRIEEITRLGPAQRQSWLVRTARYLAANRGRRNLTRRKALHRLRQEPLPFVVSPEDEFIDRADAGEHAERIDAVRQTLEELGAEHRRILVMHAWGYSGAQIAESLEISPGAARQRLMRARIVFREAFERRTDTESTVRSSE